MHKGKRRSARNRRKNFGGAKLSSQMNAPLRVKSATPKGTRKY